MPFIDWNKNGKIDPEDIGISIASESNDDIGDVPPSPEVKRKPGMGCLTTSIIIICVIALIIYTVLGWS